MSSSEELAYRDVIEKIILSQMDLLGTLAVTKANRINGLEIDPRGKIKSCPHDFLTVIHQLLLQYEGIAGRAATIVSKNAIADIKQKHPGLPLPPRLM